MNLGSLKFIIFLLAPAFDSMVMCLRFFYLLLKSFDEYDEIVFVFCKYDNLIFFHVLKDCCTISLLFINYDSQISSIRDVRPEIRATCIGEIGLWMKNYR